MVTTDIFSYSSCNSTHSLKVLTTSVFPYSSKDTDLWQTSPKERSPLSSLALVLPLVYRTLKRNEFPHEVVYLILLTVHQSIMPNEISETIFVAHYKMHLSDRTYVWYDF